MIQNPIKVLLNNVSLFVEDSYFDRTKGNSLHFKKPAWAVVEFHHLLNTIY